MIRRRIVSSPPTKYLLRQVKHRLTIKIKSLRRAFEPIGRPEGAYGLISVATNRRIAQSIYRTQQKISRAAIAKTLSRSVPSSTAVKTRRTATLVMVARARNEGTVLKLLDQIGGAAEVHIHFLDWVPKSLASFASSTGAGLRMPLLRSLIRTNHATGLDLILADDDVNFEGLAYDSFIEVCNHARFDAAQPAHSVFSNYSYSALRVRSLDLARRSNFIEVGPFVWMSPKAQLLFVPRDDDIDGPGDWEGMGWGVDLDWSVRAIDKLRLGVIDATPMLHLGSIADEYDAGPEYRHLERRLTENGISDIRSHIKADYSPWRIWSREPPW